jgi:hypothetical protein
VLSDEMQCLMMAGPLAPRETHALIAAVERMLPPLHPPAADGKLEVSPSVLQLAFSVATSRRPRLLNS